LKVEVEKLGNGRVRLRIEIPAEEVNEELERSYRALRSKVTVPGFRRGKVPSSILKARFAEHVKIEAVQNLVPPAYEQALRSEQLVPLSTPETNPPLTEMTVEEDQPLKFEVVVNVKPDFVLPAYEALEIDKSPANVSREEVNDFIQQLQEEHAVYTPLEVERPVQENDCVRIDWECLVDGEVIPDGRKEDVDVELGKGVVLPAIESALVGMRAGEIRRIEVDFDANHENPQLAGKHAIFNVTLHAITEKQLPALDDEFAKDLEYESYEKLHGELWSRLVEQKKTIRYQEQRDEIVQQLIEKIELEVPEAIIDPHVQRMTQDILQQLKREGKTPEEARIDIHALQTELHEGAIRRTKQAWIFDAIAERENIKVTDDELDIELRRMAERQNRDPQKYKELLEAANRLEGLRDALRDEKIFQFLIQNASAKRSLIISR
jgi:trigger factor